MSANSHVVAAAHELLEKFSFATDITLSGASRINLHEPVFDSEEIAEVSASLRSGFVSSVGPHVEQFANSLSKFASVPFVVPIINGTSALQLALHLAGVGPGDEVVVPALSFVATANAVRFLGAEPVFADSVKLEESTSMGISCESVKELLANYVLTGNQYLNKVTGSRLGAIVPMHTLGRITDLTEIRNLVSELVPIVEDAAEALGSFSDGKHSGSELDAVLSFNGNKVITTGGGGAFLTSSEDRANRARLISATSKVPHPWRFSHSELAWNFRMPALNAALGVAQMTKLPNFLETKRELYGRYETAFAESEFFEFIENPAGQEPNNWLIPIRSKGVEIAGVLDLVNQWGLHCRPMWDLLPTLDFYKRNFSADLKNSRQIRDEVICLPSSANLLSK
jgi:perosamine synthetase